MAQRPVFVPLLDGDLLVRTAKVSFNWHPGLSVSQKQRSIASLHASAQASLGFGSILEVSGKSKERLGVALSAFNLKMRVPGLPEQITVECVFQGSKVFEHGGPYSDIFHMTSLEAKRDERLRSSGRLVGFQFQNVDWPNEPQTAFYDWLYISSLRENGALSAGLSAYSAFTDIEFNPEKSINCQAHAVALFVSLSKRGVLEAAIQDRDTFLRLLKGRPVSNARQKDDIQGSLF